MKEIKQLLEITRALKSQHNRSFTLDGKLVGDIGEVLAKEKYGLQLYDENHPIHDAYQISTGRKVQIKSSFKGYSYFPCNQVPDYFLSLVITEKGELIELFNGPGQYIVEHYIKPNKLKPFRNSYYSLAKGILQRLNQQVPDKDKISTVK